MKEAAEQMLLAKHTKLLPLLAEGAPAHKHHQG